MPGIPAALRLAAALGVPVERLTKGVKDPAKEGLGLPEKRHPSRKKMP
jgi:hypothetical protein